jgi:DhnA family fructose-bisphosphate aldolase class Ia
MRSRRLTRLFDPRSSRTLIVPLDHGLAHGPIPGLRDVPKLVDLLGVSRVDAVVLNAGLAFRCSDVLAKHPTLGLVVHLSAGSRLSEDPFERGVVGSVRGAVALGADAVSVQLNVGGVDDVRQLTELARVAEECRADGMPLVAMMYTRGDVADVASVAHAARMADELGADIVKVAYPGTASALSEIVRSVHCSVVCAGGAAAHGPGIVDLARSVVRAGGSGLAVGRQVFQDDHPQRMIRELRRILHEENMSGIAPSVITDGWSNAHMAAAAS